MEKYCYQFRTAGNIQLLLVGNCNFSVKMMPLKYDTVAGAIFTK
jgi:hypothetical protein